MAFNRSVYEKHLLTQRKDDRIGIYDRYDRRSTVEYTVTFTWDNEADVWIATSKDIPGLILESGSFDALLERVRFAIPELLKMNQ